MRKLINDYKSLVWNPQVEFIKKHPVAVASWVVLSAIFGFAYGRMSARRVAKSIEKISAPWGFEFEDDDDDLE